MSTTTLDAPNTIIEELENASDYVLNAHIRCDVCGSQAYNRATLHNDLELFFCSHHGTKHFSHMQPILKSWYSENIRLVGENRLVGSEN